MKQHLKWTAVLLSLCMAFLLAPPLSRAAGTGRTLYPEPGNDGDNLVEFVEQQARDGDTIVLENGCYANNTNGNDAPWVIKKAVTFQGGSLSLQVSGVILDADVTFQNTSLSFEEFIRNAIMANGHTLTLNNVTGSSGARPINLFCGGLYGTEFQSTPGSKGTVIIRGTTSLEGAVNTTSSETGNIYAGNLCMGGLTAADSYVNGPANTFQGDAQIIIEAEKDSTLGHIFAGGAQQKIPAGAQSGKVILIDPEQYKVSGRVDVSLNYGTVKQVYGMGAGETHVTYHDTGAGYESKLWVDALSSLTASKGHLVPMQAIYDGTVPEDIYGKLSGEGLRAGAALSVLPDAKVDLGSYMGNLEVDSFTGGGKLALGKQQTLTVAGKVTGETLVAVGGFGFQDVSKEAPVMGHPYIHAPQSQTGAFRLAPPSGQSLAFSRDESGNWFVGDGAAEDTVLVESIRFTKNQFFVNTANEEEVYLPLEIGYAENNAQLLMLDFIPVTIQVNGYPANRVEDKDGYFTHTTRLSELSMMVIDDELFVTNGAGGYPIEKGTYSIALHVPKEHSASGKTLIASTVLTVGDEEAPDTGCEIVKITPGGSTVAVQLAGDQISGLVMAAAYDANGRMTGFGTAPAAAAGSGEVSVPVDLTGAREVRVFLTNSLASMIPLCTSRSAAVN